MPCCSILQCKNDSRRRNIRNGGVSYHRFPKTATVKEKWIDATGRVNWMPTKSSAICSEHFLEDDYLITCKGYRYLKSTVFPTLKILKYVSQDPNVNDTTASSSIKRGRTEGPDFGKPKKGSLQKESVPIQSNAASCEIKSEKLNAASGSSTASLPGKRKLIKQLKSCRERMKKQAVKIKRLQSTNVRLKKKKEKLETVLAELEEKFGKSKDDPYFLLII